MRVPSCKFLLPGAFCLLLGGCAGSELAAWNPYYRSEWKKDEEHGPTFHAQLAELRAIRKNPDGMPPNEQANITQLLTNIVEDSPNAILRAEAALTLAALPTAEAIPALRSAAADEDPEVRIAACRAFGRRGGSDALDALTTAVRNDTDLDVRIAAAGELKRFSDQQSVQALAVALNDKDPALQHQAVQSLKKATGQNYGDSVPAWRDFVEGRTPTAPESPSIAERLLRFRLF